MKGLSALVPQLSKGMRFQALCTREAVVKMSDRVTPPIQGKKAVHKPLPTWSELWLCSSPKTSRAGVILPG